MRASLSAERILSVMIAVFVQKWSFQPRLLTLIPALHKGRGSSVVERIIGNDEVGSSILPRGTSFHRSFVWIGFAPMGRGTLGVR